MKKEWQCDAKSKIIEELSTFSMDYLRSAYKTFFAESSGAKNKTELIDEIVYAFDFPESADFQKWFSRLPDLTKEILTLLAFTDYLSIKTLEKKLGVSLLEEKHNARVFKAGLNLDFMRIDFHYGNPVTSVPQFLGIVIREYLNPPNLFNLSDCKTYFDDEEAWDISHVIIDIFPLLCVSLENVFSGIGEGEREKKVKNGFTKKTIAELCSSVGFPPFSIDEFYMPNGVDLASRFILCMKNFKIPQITNAQNELRDLVKAFFSEETQYHGKWNPSDRAYIEYNILLDHLTRSSGYYLDKSEALPLSRKVFHEILLYIANDGYWFDADKIAEHIKVTMKDFSFCSLSLEKSLKAKAESITVDGESFTNIACDEFYPDGIMRYYLLVRPLVKAYFYLFAIFGVLEIVQRESDLVKSYGKKQYPFSPYDSLKAVRITEFGRWCFDLTSARPENLSDGCYATADARLFLVTVHGKSIEREVFLDKIGERLGEKRWSVSAESFICDCDSKEDVISRIERFKSLIDPNPAQHWEDFFRRILDRVGIFSSSSLELVLYDLPENQELTEELFSDPNFKRMVRRVEGGMIAVAFKEQKKFFAILNKHGIVCKIRRD